jgi:hypothetical protein
VKRTRLVLAATAVAFASFGTVAPAANACVGAPCTALCTVVSTKAWQKVFGPTPCPR